MAVPAAWTAFRKYNTNDQCSFAGLLYTSLLDDNFNHVPGELASTAWWLQQSGNVRTVAAGTNVTITGTNEYPIINATGGGGGVQSVEAGPGIAVDNTDPTAPIVSLDIPSYGDGQIFSYPGGTYTLASTGGPEVYQSGWYNLRLDVKLTGPVRCGVGDRIKFDLFYLNSSSNEVLLWTTNLYALPETLLSAPYEIACDGVFRMRNVSPSTRNSLYLRVSSVNASGALFWQSLELTTPRVVSFSGSAA
jgi:hypothetical protein